MIDSRTGNMWSYQEGTDGSPSGKGYTPRYSPTVAQFAAIPTGLTALLWNPLVSPELRAALYKVLASVPGVTVSSSARDSEGKPAVEISRVDTSGLPGGKSDGIGYATYEDSATGAVLESTVTYPPGSDIVTPQDPTGDSTVVDTIVYTSVRWANAVPANLYGG